MTARDGHARRRKARSGWLIHCVAAMLLCAPGALVAAPTAQPIIVLKTTVGARDPKIVDPVIGLIDAQFESEGFAARPETIRAILGGLRRLVKGPVC
jgi:hypothetical protein